jgi:hypothetical protein
MATFTQLGHCLIALYRLTAFNQPGISWCREGVKTELDIAEVSRLMAQRWEEVPRAAGIEREGLREGEEDEDELGGLDPWSYTTKRALGIGSWWEGKVSNLAVITANRESAAAVEASEPVAGSGVPEQQQIEALEFDGVDIDILDDPWMMDLLGGGYDFNVEPQLW